VDEAGGLTATIDVPQQGATGISLHDVRYEHPAVYFEMLEGARKATYDGQLNPDGTINGTFSQSGVTGSFTLHRAEAPPPTAEAVEADVPYREEEVSFANGDITLAGTLTLPEGDGPFPAVILISGSGQQNRDEALSIVPGYKPFQEIADTLTRQGIAVLRYDDRGIGGSSGDPSQASSADFADDAEAAFTYLQGRPEIDGGQIGMLGHSEGGIIEAIVAARNPDVAFLISMAGTAVSGYDTIIKQVEQLKLASGATAEQAAAAADQQRSLMDLVVAQDWTTLESVMNQMAQAQINALPDDQKAAIGDLDAYAKQQVAVQLAQLQSPWYQFFLSHDPGEDFAKVTVPVLGVYGGKDAQVDADVNTAALQAALEKAGNQDVTIIVIPTANHLFQDATTGSVQEYAQLEPHLMPEFLTTISDWLAAHVH
ncbi:MAG: alpha/beta fold hydrolase, partial [Caldilineales bacterium]